MQPSATLPQSQPACLSDVSHRPGRLRQLGGVGVVGRAGDGDLGHLHRQARTAGSRGRPRQPHPLRRARRRRSLRPAVPDLGHHLAGLQHLRRQQPVLRLARRARLQGELQPPVHHALLRVPQRLDRRPGSSTPSTRWCGGSSATATTSATSTGVDTDRRGARAAASTASSCRSATTSTGPARSATNVEAARAAGVNLAFFSGNDVFWKTRWENSIDGSEHAVPHAGLLQGDARQREDRSAAERVDRHVARPALQPAGRWRPSRRTRSTARSSR